MNPTAKTFDYLKSMGSVYEKTEFVIQVFDGENCKVTVIQRDWYIKRNFKRCYVDVKSQLLTVSTEYIIATPFLSQDPETFICQTEYRYRINGEHRQEIINQFKTPITNEQGQGTA